MYKKTFNSRGNNNNFNRRPGNNKRFRPAPVNSALFVKRAENSIAPEAPVIKHQFSDFLISDQLKRNIAEKGYVTPTPIQDQVIPAVIEGKDVVGIANTGTGKTGAFLIPLINKIFFSRAERVLIVAPTRELAVQIQDECKSLAFGMNIFSVLTIGGASMYNQTSALRRNPHFIIGTPGRLKDLVQNGKLNLSSFNNIVLDEVDRMMDMGFITDIQFLIGKLPQRRQSLFFSATLPPATRPLMQAFLNNPVTISVKTQDTAAGIEQDVIKVKGRNKIDLLHNMLAEEGFDKVLVFGRTKWGIEKLSKILLQRGLKVAAIHGNKSQGQRQRALDEFKKGNIQVLLATDVASRGLDIENVTHVINYDQPASYEDYIHRIGRTGRAERKGIALTFVD